MDRTIRSCTTDHRSSHYVGRTGDLGAVARAAQRRALGVYAVLPARRCPVRARSRATRALSLSQAQTPTGQPGGGLRRGSIRGDGLADAERRRARDAISQARCRENAVSPRVGGRGPSATGGVGRSRLLRPILSTATTHDGVGPAAGTRRLRKGSGSCRSRANATSSTRSAWPSRCGAGRSIVDYFHTNARNFFDHDADRTTRTSSFPLTIDTARIRGWEATIRSPRRQHTQAHLAYSHQFVEGRGGVTGGLTSFESPSDEFFFLDHDQRDTLTGGVDVELSSSTLASIPAGLTDLDSLKATVQPTNLRIRSSTCKAASPSANSGLRSSRY